MNNNTIIPCDRESPTPARLSRFRLSPMCTLSLAVLLSLTGLASADDTWVEVTTIEGNTIQGRWVGTEKLHHIAVESPEGRKVFAADEVLSVTVSRPPRTALTGNWPVELTLTDGSFFPAEILSSNAASLTVRTPFTLSKLPT